MSGLAKALVVLSVVVFLAGVVTRLVGAELLPPGGFLRTATYLAILAIAVDVCLKERSGS